MVSFIIPTYNRPVLLAEAIKSVMAQTYRLIECIVVDDGSTDSTREVVEKLAREAGSNFSLRYVYQQNAGSQVARNTGTAAATGEFIQYLDSDDVLYPGKIEAQIEFFSLHPECDAVFGDWEKGTIDDKEPVIAYKSDDLISQFLTQKCIANFSMLMRISLVRKIGDWDVTVKRNQEIDFHLRGVLAGGNFAYQPGLCGLWRTHQGERIVTATSVDDIIYFYKKWERILRRENLFSNELSIKVGDLYMWYLSQYKDGPAKEVIKLLKEVIRLNPAIGFNQSRKLALLKRLIGVDSSLTVWLSQFRRTTSA